MIRQADLIERVRKYDPGVDEDLLNRAYVFSMKAHGSQVRASGDPYFSHPLEVAGIVTDLRLDDATVATALLHDTVEDTIATLDQIEARFGPENAQLVDGVTKLSRLELTAGGSPQAENFRKLLLAMSNDLRVLLVKLADRLHNMRTLSFIRDPEKRRRIAHETMEIYAPLAERIGMQAIKEELQNLAFAELNAEARKSVLARLEYLRMGGADLVTRICEELERTLASEGQSATVLGREKRPYSIWRKMEQKNISFEQLADIMAFRIIVGTDADCYRALGIVHGAYRMVPNRFKDYISTPKRNNYRSLHTTVIGPEKQRIEVQIRTHNMHEIAELGVAAHWTYKSPGAEKSIREYRWIRELLDILDQASDPEEFLEHTKLEMFQDQVFCFSPKGDLIALPRGATPVDFAYAVHTDVGDTTVGAKVNGRIAPLRTELHNGDQVEIIRSKAQTPSPTWQGFVVTGKARSAVRRFVRNQERTQFADLGRAILERAFAHTGRELSDKAIGNGLKKLAAKSAQEVFEKVGEGVLTAREVIEAVLPGEKAAWRLGLRSLAGAFSRSRNPKGGDRAIPIRGLIPGMAVHLANCCHPLPGDRIVGIVTEGKGVTIHTIDCESLENYSSSPENWLDVAWSVDEESTDFHVGRIDVILTNEPGSLNAMTTVIARNLGNISNLKITNRSPETFEFLIDVEVKDVKHLSNIVAALRTDPSMHTVTRVRG